MSDSPFHRSRKDDFETPQELRRLLVQKEELIRAQAQRISRLEAELDRVKVDRDSVVSKLRSLSPNPSFDKRQDLSRIAIEKSQNGKLCPGMRVTPDSRTPSELSSLTAQKGIERSTSLSSYPCDGSTPKLSAIGHQHSISHHGFVLQRQRSQLRIEDDAKLRQSRSSINSYELSVDLHDKQIEMLERKYGGRLRTKRAAVTIQQAFRKYSMNKNFEKLRSGKSEKRRSRILGEYGRSASLWSELENLSSMDISAMGKSEDTCRAPKLERMHTTDANFNCGLDNDTPPSSEQSFQKQYHHQQGVHRNQKLQRSTGIDIKDNRRNVTTSHHLSPSEANNNRNTSEYNDSSSSNTPQDSPINPSVDLHSVNFENLLESRETDILNDSFHSDESQDNNHQSDTLKRTKSDDEDEGTLKRSSQLASFHISGSEDSILSDIQIHVDAGTPVDDFTPLSGALNKYQENLDVRLHNRKCQSDTALMQQVKSSPEASPIWKRKSGGSTSSSNSNYSIKSEGGKRMSNISETSEPDSVDGQYEYCSSRSSDTASLGSNSLGSDTSHGYRQCSLPNMAVRGSTDSSQLFQGQSGSTFHAHPRVSDKQRKREYRIGLNLFNKKPDKGILYLIHRCFIEDVPAAVAKFLIARKGLSKQMIGEYLGNLQNQFNMEVLDYFIDEIDLSGLQIDVALRKFQTFFRMPGEAQKIERLMEAFAHRYCICNPDIVKKFKNCDTVFLLAFAIIMLNTDLHNCNIKQERRMKGDDFIKNLRGIDDGEDVDRDLLMGVYDRVRVHEFKPGSDHATQVMKVEQSVVGKRPQLALPHRRLVCYCRLYEVHDPNKREKLGLHQREVFLFNDLLLVTKIFSKKKTGITYSFRQSFMLCGMQVYLYETPHYQYGIRLTNNLDGKVLITFNARNEHDRSKFVEDLKECIMEMNEMEALRIEEELHKQKHSQKNFDMNRISSDSGVVDMDLLRTGDSVYNRLSAPDCGGLKKSALSNSLIDLSENGRQQRRGSGGSLDSGMFLMQTSTTSVSTVGQDEPPRISKSSSTTSTSSSGSGFKFFNKKTSVTTKNKPTGGVHMHLAQDGTEV
ncbi:IQ motif and SEC7 domain-containing protein 1-like [Tubulanus polymorphus]|uniref:IQ motif and SEC7 domain-containing protein 1-like n=1 Tax=Tubulanus polymorphus TaxID=672921 RepID=UPI003DA61B0A